MINKALILSAGQGKRLLPLTDARPKCLLPLGGQTLLEWQIAALVANNICDITVVTGFHAEAVEAVLHRVFDGVRIRTLFNPFFEVADNVGSCYIARDVLSSGDCVLINGDTLFHPHVLSQAMSCAEGPITVTVDRKRRYDADDMKVRDDGKRLLGIGKSLPAADATAESIGMLFFDGAGGEVFVSALEGILRDPTGLKRWYLSVVDILARSIPVHVVSIAGLPWCEVDYPRDLAAAEALGERLRLDLVEQSDRPSSIQSGRAR
jgi:L-glutamine-phosphate cytidylyltransferase